MIFQPQPAAIEGDRLSARAALAGPDLCHREAEFVKEASRIGLLPERRCAVRYVAHRPAKRVLQELSRSAGEVEDSTLTIEATGPFDYTPEYRALISDLMLNF